MALSTFPLCTNITISKPFLSFKTETLHPWNNNSWGLLPCEPVNHILPSASINLTTLDTSYKWNHTVFVLLWLPHFTQYNVLKVHSYHSSWHNFLKNIAFKAEYYSTVHMYHILSICSSTDGYLGCFNLLAIINNVVINMGVQIFVQSFHFFWVYTQKWNCWIIW